MAPGSRLNDVGRDPVLPYIRRWRSALLAVALLSALLATASVQAQETPPHRAGLVVVHGDGRVVTRCVTFEGESITGADLLRRSGLPVVLSVFGGMGEAVCAIDGEGCPAEDCFCQCKGGACAYWTYSHLQPDGTWSISVVGAGAWRLRDGDVDGWVWGDGSVTPPSLSFDEICGASPSPSPTSPADVDPRLTPSPSPSPASPLPSSPPPDCALLALLLPLMGGLSWTAMRRRG